MLRRRLGGSGIDVGVLGLGCMEIGGPMKDGEGHLLARPPAAGEQVFSLGDVDDDESVRTIRGALDRGVDFLDTAPAYGAGHSERILARALAGRRDAVVIGTKFGKPIDEADNRFGRYLGERELVDSIRGECEASLRRLGTDRIDLYQYHQMDFGLLEYAGEVIGILEDLVAEGKVRWYGWSTEDPECARVFGRGPHCVAIQHNMSVVSPSPQMLAVCDELGLASIARGVLGMGFLTGRYTAENYRTLLREDDYRRRAAAGFLEQLGTLDPVRDVLTADGRTLAQGALAWVLARSDRTIAISGFRTAEQVTENIDAADLGPLTGDQMAQIDLLLGR